MTTNTPDYLSYPYPIPFTIPTPFIEMDETMNGLEGPDKRHPSTEHMLRMLRPNTNLAPDLFKIASDFNDLAIETANNLPDSPELTAGLRKLLEAKDCIVRAYVFKENPDANVDYRDR